MTTEYEHDDDGRLVRSITTREPEWDEQERAWMLALADYESRICPLCGRPLSVCTDPANEGKVKAALPRRCFFTTAVEQAREPYNHGKAKNANALLFGATLGQG